MSATRWIPRRGIAPQFRTRVDGYARRNAAWICRVCRGWHDAKPQAGCQLRGCTSGKFFLCDSRGEAQRFVQLWLLQDDGEIRGLEHHPRFPLLAPDRSGALERIGWYVADTRYTRAGEVKIEDFKPRSPEALDPLFKWKRRHFERQYGLRITLVY